MDTSTALTYCHRRMIGDWGSPKLAQHTTIVYNQLTHDYHTESSQLLPIAIKFTPTSSFDLQQLRKGRKKSIYRWPFEQKAKMWLYVVGFII